MSHADTGRAPAAPRLSWLILLATPSRLLAVWRLVGALRLADSRPWLALRAEVLAAAGLTAAGFVLRLVDLEHVPTGIHGDESGFGLIALSILDGSGPHPFGRAFLDDPALAFYVKVPFLALADRSIAAVRLASALAGSLTVPVVYLLARLMFGRLVGFAAAAFLATAAVHIHFSRLGINFAEVSLFASLSVVGLWLGSHRGRLVWWLLAGMAAGFALYFHFSSRTFVLVLPLFLLYLLARRPAEWRRWLVSGACAGLGLGMVAGPLLVYGGQPLQTLISHPASRLIFTRWEQISGQYGSTDPGVVLWRQVERNVEGFVRGSDSSSFYPFPGAPLLNEISAPLAALGLALATVGARDPRHALLAIWFWTTFLVGGVLTDGPPQYHRLLVAVPPALMCGAVALERLAGFASGTGGGPARAAAMGAAALVPLVAGALDVNAYFGRYAVTYPYADTTGAARYIAGLSPEYQVFVVASPYYEGDHGTIQLLAGRGRARELLNPTAQLAAPPLARPLAFVVFEPRREMLSLLQERYPGGTLEPIERPPGRFLNTAYLVPADPAAAPWPASQGLAGSITSQGASGPASTRVDWAISFRNLAALAPGPGRPYRASWRGQLVVPRQGRYDLEIAFDGVVSLRLDGEEQIRAEPREPRPGTASASVSLEAGPHPIEIDYRSIGGRGLLEFRWRPPGEERALVPPSALRP